MTAFIPLVILLAGLLVYVLASNAKVVEAGRLAYACGLLALCFQLAGRTLKLFTLVLIPFVVIGIAGCAGLS